jgi:hypothetical protein
MRAGRGGEDTGKKGRVEGVESSSSGDTFKK